MVNLTVSRWVLLITKKARPDGVRGWRTSEKTRVVTLTRWPSVRKPSQALQRSEKKGNKNGACASGGGEGRVRASHSRKRKDKKKRRRTGKAVWKCPADLWLKADEFRVSLRDR